MLLRVLLVAADAELRQRIVASLVETDALVTEERRADRLWARLGQESFDLVLADGVSLPAATVGELRDLPDGPEVVLLIDDEDLRERAELQAAGTFALVSSRLDDDRLRETLTTIVERYREIGVSRLRADEHPRSALDDFSSDSLAMKRLLTLARKVVAADSSLLILGETGVGKEWLGRAIHAEGPRRRAPFVAVNCAAVPETLLESELFGHEKGAFTGAVRARRGAFELAHQGTLFLDEIGDVPVHLQVKLLRALQERQVQRIGSERALPVSVRIMAATNRDLRAAIENKEFRRDLYYRLSVVTLTVPPLRERPEDIGPLIENYLAQYKGQFGRDRLKGIDEAAVQAMLAYDWPGNVRELINVMERAVLLCDQEAVSLADLPEEIAGAAASRMALGEGRRDGGFEPWLRLPLDEGRRGLVEAFERLYLARVLEETGGNIGETARRSGVDPRTLYNKMKGYGLRKEAFRRKAPSRTG